MRHPLHQVAARFLPRQRFLAVETEQVGSGKTLAQVQMVVVALAVLATSGLQVLADLWAVTATGISIPLVLMVTQPVVEREQVVAGPA